MGAGCQRGRAKEIVAGMSSRGNMTEDVVVTVYVVPGGYRSGGSLPALYRCLTAVRYT